VELYQQHDPGEITVEIKAGAKPRTLAELVPEAEAHIRNHLKKLRKGLKASA
jgi:D-tyrosyl-tRNA(Tyr) deacylase